MTAIFADTHFYVALLSRRDKRHKLARDWASQQRSPLMTTEFVLLEVANFCQSSRVRRRFAAFAEALKTNSLTTVIPCDSIWFQRGLDRFASRFDKEWSLTDWGLEKGTQRPLFLPFSPTDVRNHRASAAGLR